MKQKNFYWTFFKCGLFYANKQRGHPLTQKRNRLLMMGLLIITFNGLFFSACVDQDKKVDSTSTQLGISNNGTTKMAKAFDITTTIKVEKTIGNFIAQESSISNFHQMMNDIYSLKTLTKIKSKQLILFVPEDAAFEKLGIEEKEKLLTPASLTQRHELFKNSLLLHNRSEGDWNGQGITYGEQSITMNAQTGIVSIKNRQARILKKINVEGGHLIYIVDTILT